LFPQHLANPSRYSLRGRESRSAGELRADGPIEPERAQGSADGQIVEPPVAHLGNTVERRHQIVGRGLPEAVASGVEEA
jgi:hypothetical protein